MFVPPVYTKEEANKSNGKDVVPMVIAASWFKTQDEPALVVPAVT
jgi:hypothetical protein